jgi:hypothetical protein
MAIVGFTFSNVAHLNAKDSNPGRVPSFECSWLPPRDSSRLKTEEIFAHYFCVPSAIPHFILRLYSRFVALANVVMKDSVEPNILETGFIVGRL